MCELSNEQIKRQDFVDNAIMDLIRELNYTGKPLKWDIEMISDVRDTIRYWLVERLKIANEMKFYPYLKE